MLTKIEITEKVEEKEKTNAYKQRCLDVSICPKCGGNLYEDSDIGVFVEVECDSCDFGYCKQGYGHYST